MSGAPSENELIQQLIKGDAAAFTEVYEVYKDSVFAFAYSLTKSRETAEEVVQNVFLKLWEKREQLKIDHSFLAFVKKVTYNQVIDFFRKVKTDKALQQKIYLKIESIRSGSEEYLLGKELEKLYRQAIETLPAQQKKIYLLSRESDLTYEEIANLLNLSRNTVRNHLAEAVKAIRCYVSYHSDLAVFILATCLITPRH
jgi:RNA polymerase sigma-70 factor (family 1)